MPQPADDGAASLAASDQPKGSPTPSPPPIAEVKATSKKRGISEMTSQILWDQTDVANELKLTKVSKQQWVEELLPRPIVQSIEQGSAS